MSNRKFFDTKVNSIGLETTVEIYERANTRTQRLDWYLDLQSFYLWRIASEKSPMAVHWYPRDTRVIRASSCGSCRPGVLGGGVVVVLEVALCRRWVSTTTLAAAASRRSSLAGNRWNVAQLVCSNRCVAGPFSLPWPSSAWLRYQPNGFFHFFLVRLNRTGSPLRSVAMIRAGRQADASVAEVYTEGVRCKCWGM